VAEALSAARADALKFRTVRCMLTYLETATAPVSDIFVADYTTGQLIPASEAAYVAVRIDERTGRANYGIGDVDFVAFGSEPDARNMAVEYGGNVMSWAAVKYYAPFLPSRD
jgi:nitrous oxide reductase accessory protein NosL